MPELPEVEVVRLSLVPRMTGRRLGRVQVREKRLRTTVDVRALRRGLPGCRVVGLRRRAKYILMDLDSGGSVLMHLGMTGRLGVLPAEVPLKKHDHVLVALDDGNELRFNDARRFGLFDWLPPGAEGEHPRLRHLGVDPFDRRFTGARLHAAARGRRAPVKSFLMDGRQIVGVGNIYASESLWKAGIHPGRAAGRLSLARWQRLVQAVRQVLRASIAQGGTTLRDFAAADGTMGYFALKLDVYDQAGRPCRRCGGVIRRVVHSGRSTFYCPSCQH